MKKKNGTRKTKTKGQRQDKRTRELESIAERKSSDLPPLREDDRRYDAHATKPNDWRWYAATPQLIRDYANYPFGNPLGNMLQTGNAAMDSSAIPGILVYNFDPAIGVATNPNDPINVAMRRVYSFVRHANSGARNYDAPDMMLYLLACDSCHMFHHWLKRLYGVMQDYAALNRYYPAALVYAMGVDFKDVQANINDLRGFINQYALKLSQLWIPNTMSYMARHAWMVDGIYVDDPSSPKVQTYMYNPLMYMQFVLAGDPAVGAINALQTGLYMHGSGFSSGSAMNFKDLQDLGNDLINPLLANEDIGIMSGDILKAYGENGLVKVTAVDEGYQVLPVYSEEVLSQFENTRAVNRPGFTRDSYITQATAVGTGYLVSQPQALITMSGVSSITGEANQSAFANAMMGPYMNRFVLNFHKQDVAPEEVMVATRNLFTIDKDSVTYGMIGNNTNVRANLQSCGSEIVRSMVMYRFAKDTDGTLALAGSTFRTVQPWPTAATPDTIATNAGYMLDLVGRLESFDWHPAIYPMLVVTVDGDVTWSNVRVPLQDMSNYTFLNNENIYNMNSAALLSEFSVPMIG